MGVRNVVAKGLGSSNLQPGSRHVEWSARFPGPAEVCCQALQVRRRDPGVNPAQKQIKVTLVRSVIGSKRIPPRHHSRCGTRQHQQLRSTVTRPGARDDPQGGLLVSVSKPKGVTMSDVVSSIRAPARATSTPSAASAVSIGSGPDRPPAAKGPEVAFGRLPERLTRRRPRYPCSVILKRSFTPL